MSQDSIGLLTVQGDTEYMLVRRRGRFAMERAQAASPRHRSEAVKSAMLRFLKTMASMGYQFVDDGWVEVRGNLPHLEYSESVAKDLGPLAQPHPGDVKANAAFRRDELSKVAAAVPDPDDLDAGDLIDFQIVATFKKAKRKVFLPKLKGR